MHQFGIKNNFKLFIGLNISINRWQHNKFGSVYYDAYICSTALHAAKMVGLGWRNLMII